MKTRILLLIFALSTIFFTGCANNATPNKPTTPTSPDVVTSASVVDTAEDFEKAIGSSGTWIVAILKDLTVDKDIVLEGEFQNTKNDTQRKIALYSQDEKFNITDRYTLTAPKLTINSPKASLQHGVFNGDLHVLQNDFELIDTKVNGNIYFATDEAMSTFKMDADSAVSGEQQLITP